MMQENGLGDFMSLKKFEKLHSNTELVLAIVNNFCKKHNEEPHVCGATKEARELLGDVLKTVGPIVGLLVLLKTRSK